MGELYKGKNILDQFRLQFNFTAISAAVSAIFITSRNCCGAGSYNHKVVEYKFLF